MTSIPAPAPGLTGVARKEPFCGVPGSIISSEEGSTTWSRQLCHGLLRAPLVAITHTMPGERGLHPHTQSHTQDRSAGSQRHQGVLKRLSSGAPCRPDYKEAGWQGRAGLHLLKTERTPVSCGRGCRGSGMVESAGILTCHRLVVGRGAHGLGWVGCCWQPRLGDHGVVALVRWSRVAGRLQVRGVGHRGGHGGGHNRCKESPGQERQAGHPALQLRPARALASPPHRPGLCCPQGVTVGQGGDAHVAGAGTSCTNSSRSRCSR